MSQIQQGMDTTNSLSTRSIFTPIVSQFKKHTTARIIFMSISTIYIIGSIILSYIFPDFVEKGNVGIAFLYFITLSVSALILVCGLISFTNIDIDQSGIFIELANIKKERELIKDRILQKNNNIIDTIQLSLNQITEYYTISLNQARNSYKLSITAILIGLFILAIGVWLMFFQVNPNLTVGVISGISGILTEFLGGFNLYIYNKSLKQLNLYFNQLIRIQDTMLAIELCEKIDNSDPLKIQITEQIISTLIGRSSSKTTDC